MVVVYFLSLSFMTLEIFVGDQGLYFPSPRSSGSITPSTISCFVDATVLFISLWQNYLKLPYVSAFEICAICSREATSKTFFFLNIFIYLFLAVLGLRFCARAFSSCGERGPLFIAVRGPLTLRSTGSRRAGSVVVAHGLSCSTARGIFPDQGSNPCLLHWQADSFFFFFF